MIRRCHRRRFPAHQTDPQPCPPSATTCLASHPAKPPVICPQTQNPPPPSGKQPPGRSRLPEKQRLTLLEAEARTENNTGLHLNIAINYGGRDELTRATREIAQLVQRGEIRCDEITERTLSDHLFTRGQPDVDLLIRTSGEMRLSNFLLYQCAYAEFLFPKTLWPDFSVRCYDEALEAFGGRERRFGARV